MEQTLTAQREIIITPEQVQLIKNTVAKDATADELALYFYDCKRRGVHPLDRLLHFTKRSGKYTPIVSIDYMRSQSALTGEDAGMDEIKFEYGENKEIPVSAMCTVYRMVSGEKFGYTATARWKEYYPGKGPLSFMWDKMPHAMLGKCSEALARRIAFPHPLAGLHSEEEMHQAVTVAESVKPPQRKSEAAPPPPAAEVKQEAEAPATQPEKLSPLDAIVSVEEIKRTLGGPQDKPWERADITASNKIIYKTFDKKLAALCDEAHANGLQVHVTAEKGKFGYDLKTVGIIEPGP